MKPIDVTARVQIGEQSVRPRIVVGIIEGLHWDLQKDFMAIGARTIGPGLQVAAVGCEGEANLRR